VLEIAVAPRDRSDLHRRIAARFEAMMASGFLAEVRALYERTDLTAEHPSMRAVGYRQAWMFLAGRCGLDEAQEKAVAATRQLAKRQLTWLRRRQPATWLDSMHPQVASMVISALSERGFAGWSFV
jgi:tRNA dimethylallyltransferase